MVKIIRRPVTDLNWRDVFGNWEIVEDPYAIDLIAVAKAKSEEWVKENQVNWTIHVEWFWVVNL